MTRSLFVVAFALLIFGCDSNNNMTSDDISSVNAGAQADSYATSVGQTITFDVMENDKPVGQIYFGGAQDPTNTSAGTLTVTPEVNKKGGSFTFSATAQGTFQFDYTIYCNTANGRSYDTAQVTITVNP